MNVVPTELDGVFEIEFDRIEDERGWFARVFDAEVFRAHGLAVDFPQHGEAHNVRRGTLRGLHWQTAPFAETKLVRCVRGAVFDVLVDLREDSPSAHRWAAFDLREDRSRALYVPPGIAHGYQTLADDTQLHYLISAPYHPEAARGIAYDSPALAIPWPEPVTVISPRDRALPPFAPP